MITVYTQCDSKTDEMIKEYLNNLNVKYNYGRVIVEKEDGYLWLPDIWEFKDDEDATHFALVWNEYCIPYNPVFENRKNSYLKDDSYV